jgi:glucan 1,3-beta-glucosidase
MADGQKLCGVNLGGWLVLERWLTPSLFAGTTAEDEYTLCQQLGEAKYERLRKHRQTFITEADFALLQRQGINALRLPVGYWIFGGAQPFVGAIKYLDWALETAATYGMRILIDLHAAPGSQNGWDHSGKSGRIAWGTGVTTDQTLAVLAQLAARYGRAPNLWGIEVINEPHWSLPKERLVAFYQAAYHCIRAHAPGRVAVIVSDSFRPALWHTALLAPEYKNVVIDSHLYQCFSGEDKALTLPGHLAKAANEWRDTIAAMQQTHQVIVGEWSAALDPHTYAGTTPREAERMKHDYIAAQQYAFAQAAGQFYWTYKKEVKDDWDWGLQSRST